MEEKRVAVVTGGTRGMGQAISIELARRGNIVCAVYRSHEESAQKTLESLKAFEPESGIYKADVSKEEEVKQLIKKIDRLAGAFFCHNRCLSCQLYIFVEIQ